MKTRYRFSFPFSDLGHGPLERSPRPHNIWQIERGRMAASFKWSFRCRCGCSCLSFPVKLKVRQRPIYVFCNRSILTDGAVDVYAVNNWDALWLRSRAELAIIKNGTQHVQKVHVHVHCTCQPERFCECDVKDRLLGTRNADQKLTGIFCCFLLLLFTAYTSYVLFSPRIPFAESALSE